ncbi:MAG: ferric reductase-like transmembrane domain-containing protein [Verrucomicrobiota bacterium]
MTLLAATSGSAVWYLTRASGVVALLLLTATMLLGVLSASLWRSERWPRFAVADLHRNLTLVALVFIASHVVTTIADGFAPIRIKDAFVPFLSSYRPLWLGFGALALDLLLVLAVSSLLRKRIRYRTWRLLHWGAYAVWPLALVHGLGSGSDARFGWMALVAYGCLSVVLGAAAFRLLQARPRLQLAAGVAAVALAVVIVAWYRTGPARHGWASRAGTPASLLAKGMGSSSTRQPASSSARITAPFDGTVVGRMSTSGPDTFGDAAIAIALAERSAHPGVVNLTLWGSALDGGGLAMRTSEAAFRPVSGDTTYTGTVVGLDGTRVVVDLSSSAGKRLRMELRLRIEPQTRSVSGTVHAAPAPAAT